MPSSVTEKDAEHEADFLAEVAAEVLYFPMYQDVPGVSEQVTVIKERPKEIFGEKKAGGLRTEQGEYLVDGVFVLRDAVSPKQLVPGLELDGNHVKVNLSMETNIPGLFACGDITGTPYQYIKAAGQGKLRHYPQWLIWMRKNAKPGSSKEAARMNRNVWD